MVKRTITAPTTVLVAHQTGAKDSKGNPVTIRSSFTYQTVVGAKGGNYNALTSEDPGSPATATLTVSDDNFTTGEAHLIIGDVTYISGVDFVTGGGTAATATNIAAAVNNNRRVNGVTAEAVGSDVNLSGPFGDLIEDIVFAVLYRGSVVNFTLSPVDGFFVKGSPSLEGPEIT